MDYQICQTDWSKMSKGEMIKHMEVEGYLVIPNALDKSQVENLRKQLKGVKTRASDSTPLKQVHNDIQFLGGAITDLIANPNVIPFLKMLFGHEVIMMTYDYSRSEPGCPPIHLHADGQPWGSKIFGPEQSCPKLIRVLYYMEDLTPDRAPFRVVPRSHLSFHNDANPYLRYREHPEQVMVTCKTGSAVLIHPNVFHGNFPNKTNEVRELLGISYRPAWSGPHEEVPEWDEKQLKLLKKEVRELMGSRNKRIWNYHAPSIQDNMPMEAAGINPSRWE